MCNTVYQNKPTAVPKADLTPVPKINPTPGPLN